MKSQSNNSQHSSHPGGNTSYWSDEQVRQYELRQSLLSEKKEEALAAIVRTAHYFHRIRGFNHPLVLDLGSGPGTPLTLSAQILSKIPDCKIVAIDSSTQMVSTANEMLNRVFTNRFRAYVSDFNTNKFWIPEIDNDYEFVVSSGTLHYLSDVRRIPFFKEIHKHLKEGGVFIFGAACCSQYPSIAEMQHLFRAEFTYSRLGNNRPEDFTVFREKFEESDRKANINWQSPDTWKAALLEAGFREADMIWQLWIRGIFAALK